MILCQYNQSYIVNIHHHKHISTQRKYLILSKKNVQPIISLIKMFNVMHKIKNI